MSHDKRRPKDTVRGSPGETAPPSLDPEGDLVRILSEYDAEIVLRATLLWAREHEKEIEHIKWEATNAEHQPSS